MHALENHQDFLAIVQQQHQHQHQQQQGVGSSPAGPGGQPQTQPRTVPSASPAFIAGGNYQRQAGAPGTLPRGIPLGSSTGHGLPHVGGASGAPGGSPSSPPSPKWVEGHLGGDSVRTVLHNAANGAPTSLTLDMLRTTLVQMDLLESEMWHPVNERDLGVLHALPRCIRMGNIKSVSIERCGRFGTALLKTLLGGGRRCAGMESLTIRSCDVNDDSAEVIAECLPQNPFLTTLNLHNNQIGDRGAAHIARSLVAPGSVGVLRALDLTRNRIGDRGCGALAAIVQYQVASFGDLMAAKRTVAAGVAQPPDTGPE